MPKAKRPKQLTATTTKVPTGCGNMNVIVTEMDNKPFEVFCTLGKSGGCPRAFTEAIGRCISAGLRYDVPISEYVKQLKDISCPTHALEDGEKIKSCPDAIARVLNQWCCEHKNLKGED